ncbi:50S ribosomal protein L4 [Haoranjiania flava]|uniref:Large ribosomal subunit protein uL4 n=1 Tax=Haoranjiania flava TaxID=1856322 RepID=A0AAE3ILL9_9BACT|nr:50S ribosomal protein L4 [Haoranjiania flava]MCU7694417.1 50S ribosomal protein L4 [Haoranjiania flava]
MQVEVLNIQGQKTGRTIELPEDIFGVEPNDHAIYLAVKQYLAAQRQGTHKVKTRAEVQGSSRKLHKQKGTGGSRKGNIRNPLYKGGGAIFGPKPHGYAFKLNKKVKNLAKISALSYKVKDNALVVVEDLSFDAPKTKQMADVLKSMEINNKKVLYILSENNSNVYLSMRNLPKVQSTIIDDINTYNIVNADVLVLSEGAAKLIAEAAEEAVA